MSLSSTGGGSKPERPDPLGIACELDTIFEADRIATEEAYYTGSGKPFPSAESGEGKAKRQRRGSVSTTGDEARRGALDMFARYVLRV